MKRTLSNITAILLATLVLVSTLSFTVEKHYCMGQLADYAIMTKVKGCEMPMIEEHSDDVSAFRKVPCCSDTVELIEGTNTELKIGSQISLDTFQFAAVFFASYVNLFEGLSAHIIPFNNHSPPLLTKDIQVLYETYLI